MSYPLDADNHHPPEPPVFYVQCTRCNGDIESLAVDTSGDHGRSMDLFPHPDEQCVDCCEPLCGECQAEIGEQCPGCREKEHQQALMRRESA